MSQVRRKPWSVWVLFLAGPVIWYLHFWVVYLVAEAVCATGGFDARLLGLRVLSFITVAATIVAAGAIVFFAGRAYRWWRESEPTASAPSTAGRSAALDRQESQATLALGGVLLGGIFLVAVLFVGVPALFLQSC